MASWHPFTPAVDSDDDHDCTVCGLRAEDGAVDLVTLPCPAAPCEDPGNEGSCVLIVAATVRGWRLVECAYCERRADALRP